jgi:hypothetical protein
MHTFHTIPITPAEGKEVARCLSKLNNRFIQKSSYNVRPIVKWLTASYFAVIQAIRLAIGSIPPGENRADKVVTVRLLPREIAMMHYAFDYLGISFTVFQLPAVPECEYVQKRVLYLLRITEDTPKPPRTSIRREVKKNAA